MRGALSTLLVIVTAVAFGITVPFLFLGTPTAQLAAGGLAQKIFYFHVPAAIAMYVGGTVCFAASIAFLLRESDRSDALARAGAEAAVLFGAMVLVSGPLWAKKAWGVYWTWDPRLTTALLSWAIYVAVVVLRQFAGEGSAERRFAAAIGVLGWFNLWLVHLSVRLWGGNHPTVVGRGGGGLGDPSMGQALSLGFLSMFLLTGLLIWLRTRVHSTEARVERAEQEALAPSPENHRASAPLP
jgi:heme exporter protein C